MTNDRSAATRGSVKIAWSPCLNVHGASISESPVAAMPARAVATFLSNCATRSAIDVGDALRSRVLAGGGDVEDGVLEDGVAPVRDVRDVPGELSEAHRLLVRLPRELRLGRPLEQPPRGAHLVVVLREQRVLDRHAKRICPAGRRRNVLIQPWPRSRPSGLWNAASLSVPFRPAEPMPAGGV